MPNLRPAFLFAMLACAASAQTFVVDAANGPGANFTNIAPAVASVPSGSTLLVRPGAYTSFQIQGKGLTVLADAASTSVWGFGVSGTTASQPVVVEGLQVLSGGSVQLSSCLGSVTLRSVVCSSSAITCELNAALCDQVLLDHCWFRGNFGAAGSLSDCANVSMIDCKFLSTPYGDGLRSFGGGDLDLVDCELRGGTAVAPVFGYGLHMVGTPQVRLLGNTQVFAGIAGPGTLVQFAIGPQGTVRSAPAATIVGGVEPGVAFAATPECALRVTGGALGSSVTASLVGAPGAFAALQFGELGTPISVPGFADAFWLQPASSVFLAMGVPAAALTASVGVPANPQLVGRTFGWQGLTWQPADGFAVSNPASFSIR